jgi:putative addiction module killer protein
MFTLIRTAVFDNWLKTLRDQRAQERIAQRLVRVEYGDLGDAQPVGDKVYELRIDYGPGYRLYYTRQGERILILLCGGDKSDQKRDIKRAITLAAELGDRQ